MKITTKSTKFPAWVTLHFETDGEMIGFRAWLITAVGGEHQDRMGTNFIATLGAFLKEEK